MFTSNQIEEIRKKLQLEGVKDSSLPEAHPLTGKESIAVVQSGQNRKVGLDAFITSINNWCKADFLNLSKEGHSYTVEEAIAKTSPAKLGQVITFSNKKTGSWSIYQYTGETLEGWNDIDNWANILDTADYHFRGYFFNEELLKKNYPRPQVGDFAFIGTTLEEAVTFTCISTGNWYNTNYPALTFADKFKAVYSEDFGVFDAELEETLADRANKDAVGNVIHTYYASNKSLQETVSKEAVRAKEAEETNAKAISDETKARVSADTTLQGNIDKEIEELYKKSNYNDGNDIIDFNAIHFIKSSKKYICAIVDADDNVLIGLLRKTGSVEYGYGIPSQVKDYIDNQIETISSTIAADSETKISSITTFLQGFSASDTLKALLAQKADKADIDEINSKIPQVVEHPKYVYSVLDKDNNILWAVNKLKKLIELFLSLDIKGDITISGAAISLKESPKYRYAILDADDNVIEAIKYNGENEHCIGITKEIKNYIDNVVNNNAKLDSEIEEIKNSVSSLSSSIPFSKEIPSYYNNYITSRISEINNIILNTNGYNDSFIFLTDTHWGYGSRSYTNSGQSLKLIKYILANTSIDKVFYGGDVCRADATKDELYNIALMFIQQCRKELKPYAELYCVNGNHDFSFTPPSGSTDPSYFYPMAFNKNVFMDKNLNTSVVTNENDDEALYYYTDNKAQKIRYIIFNSTESHNINGIIHTNGAYIRKEQYDWMFAAIKSTPKSYKMVLQSHEPSSTGYYTTNNEFDSYVKAIIDKGSVTINNTVYDFTDIADTIFVLSGHEHLDAVTYQNGIPWIVTACDANYSTYKGGQFGSQDDYPTKTEGTIFEQTFDIVNIDLENYFVQFIRMGGGYDRIYHLGTLSVSVGSTISLTSKIEKPIWEICDATGNTIDWSTKTWTYSNANASIDSNVVTGIKEGYAVACAKDTANKKMEIFGIKINK